MDVVGAVLSVLGMGGIVLASSSGKKAAKRQACFLRSGGRARDAGAGQYRHARASGNGHRFGKPLAAFLRPLAAPGGRCGASRRFALSRRANWPDR